jgi:hypothetical protein
VTLVVEQVRGHLAGGGSFLYPGAGDPPPPSGAKVLLLTEGCVCIVGPWSKSRGLLGWAPLPKRDKQKEAGLK